MHKALHLRDDIDYICQEKKKEEDLPALKIVQVYQYNNSKDYIKKSKEKLITKASNSNDNMRTNRKTRKTRKQKREEKHLHGYYKPQTCKIAHKKTWTWQKKRETSRETESLLIAAQNKAIRTSYIKEKIDNIQQYSKCRLYGKRD